MLYALLIKREAVKHDSQIESSVWRAANRRGDGPTHRVSMEDLNGKGEEGPGCNRA
jgi:hypothetical protein